MKSPLAPALMVLLALVQSACVDFEVDKQMYVCRPEDPNDCGAGFSCLRGPGCFCVCQKAGAQAASCEDPLCLCGNGTCGDRFTDPTTGAQRTEAADCGNPPKGNCATCPADCAAGCGDGTCTPGLETAATCPYDCAQSGLGGG